METQNIDVIHKSQPVKLNSVKRWSAYCEILVVWQFTDLLKLPFLWIFGCILKFGDLASRVWRFFLAFSSRSLCRLSVFIVLFTLFLVGSFGLFSIFWLKSVLLSYQLSSWRYSSTPIITTAPPMSAFVILMLSLWLRCYRASVFFLLSF